MRKLIKTGIFFTTGLILFISGGIFFSQFNIDQKNLNKSFQKIDSDGDIVDLKKELSLPNPIRFFDTDNTDRSFSGDYDLLDKAGIIEYTNKERIKNNLVPLTESTDLDRSAEIKVDDIFARQYFEHKSPDGLDVSDLSTKAGYDYILIGENLALGDFRNNQDLINAWMNSPGHRENILKEKYINIGVSAKRGIFEGKEVWVAVQHYGLSSEICPQVNFGLQKEINTEKSNLDTKNRDLFLVLKNKIGEYNKQVRNFNTCVSEYNPKLNSADSF